MQGGDAVPVAACAAPWPSCAPWQGLATLHPARRWRAGRRGLRLVKVDMIRAGLAPCLP